MDNSQNIITELLELALHAPESELKAFLQKHWEELPQRAKDKFAVAFMADAAREAMAKQDSKNN